MPEAYFDVEPRSGLTMRVMSDSMAITQIYPIPNVKDGDGEVSTWYATQ